MSQDNRNDNRHPRLPGGRPEEPGQPPKKGPRFSIYWIYAIIFAVLIGFQLFGPFSPNTAKINEIQFREMIKSGDIAKYVIIDNRKTVKVYLTKTGREKQAEKLKKGISGKVSENGPHMS